MNITKNNFLVDSDIIYETFQCRTGGKYFEIQLEFPFQKISSVLDPVSKQKFEFGFYTINNILPSQTR